MLCASCRWRQETPYGLASCHHPLTRVAWEGSLVPEPIRQWLIHTRPQGLPLSLPYILVEAEPGAIEQGRFAWPFHYDPDAVIACNRYEGAVANDN